MPSVASTINSVPFLSTYPSSHRAEFSRSVKMSLSNEALQKASKPRAAQVQNRASAQTLTHPSTKQLVREIESQAIAAQQQISLVRTQVASKQREMRLAQLTRSEIASLPSETAVYEGVGKMYVFSPSVPTAESAKTGSWNRFVGIPAPALQDKLGSQIKEIETEVDAMGKRLHYLETTAKNSQEHIEKMLKGGGQP